MSSGGLQQGVASLPGSHERRGGGGGGHRVSAESVLAGGQGVLQSVGVRGLGWLYVKGCGRACGGGVRVCVGVGWLWACSVCGVVVGGVHVSVVWVCIWVGVWGVSG
jgi:hypothetical protein